MNPQMMIAITGKNMAKPAFDQVVTDAGRAAQAVNDNGRGMADAMSGASFQTANLAAQFNDIGVMLASGQSPLLLALQQGTQISQVLGPMGAQQAVKSLGAAFVSLFNPISLVTIGTIAAGAALFQYFTSLNTDGKASTEVIKEQNDLLRQVAENWGDAVPALKAYVDELDRAAKVADLNEATDIGVDRIFEGLRGQLSDWRAELAAARIDIQAFGGDAQEIDKLQSAFVALEAKMRDGTATLADLEAVQSALASTTGAETVPSLLGFSAILQAVAGQLAEAAAKAATLRAERDALLMAGPDPSTFYDQRDFIAEQERVNGLTSEQLALEREVARVKSEAKSADVVISEQQALTLAQQRLAAEERRAKIASDSKAGTKAAAEIDREAQAVKDLIEQLEFEQSLIGLTNTEKTIQNALRQAGATATDEERRRIAELIIVTEQQQAAQKLLTDQWAKYGQIGPTAVRGVAGALKDLKLEASEVSSIMDGLIDRALDMAINGVFDMFSGGGGGNLLMGLLGLGGKAAGGIGGGVSGGYYPGLTGPSLPSFDGGGSTGAGARTGGIDGKGGFIAILHPNEDVIDHAAGGAPGARKIEVHVHQDGNHDGPPEASVTSSGGTDIVRVLVGSMKEQFASGTMDGLMEGLYGLKRVGR